MITVKNLSKKYQDHVVLENLNLEVSKGETVALLGPSGSGKTTLLRCLVGLETFDAGEICVDGISLHANESGPDYQQRLHKVRLRCGYIFQQYQLFPHLTVLQNIMLAPIHTKAVDKPAAEALALEMLDHMGLKHKAQQKPARLSGGEQQRVAIARALALQPNYLLYDEPTSALDPERARDVWNLMKKLQTEGQTQIVVTHQEELTGAVGCRVVRMKNGKIINPD